MSQPYGSQHQGPWVSLEYTVKTVRIFQHLVQHWILYGSGALVNRDNTQHTLYNRENRKEAWSWTQGTSNRQKHELTSSCSNDNNRPRWRSSITTQAQTEATIIRWRLLNIWRLALQIQSIHGSATQLLLTVLTESSTINNKANRSRAERSSRYNTGTRGMGPTGSQLEVRADNHSNSCSSHTV